MSGSHAICVRQSSNEAYVTLLYSDEFLLGVRVFGKSIRDTGSTKDMVVLVSDGVSDYATKLLQMDASIIGEDARLELPAATKSSIIVIVTMNPRLYEKK
ncbi:unnamed protein product [Camellia sinensis]